MFKRHPDVIIAGAKRCGAGPLKMFMDAHPNIKFRYEDAHFFDKGDKKRKKWIYKLWVFNNAYIPSRMLCTTLWGLYILGDEHIQIINSYIERGYKLNLTIFDIANYRTGLIDP